MSIPQFKQDSVGFYNLNDGSFHSNDGYCASDLARARNDPAIWHAYARSVQEYELYLEITNRSTGQVELQTWLTLKAKSYYIAKEISKISISGYVQEYHYNTYFIDICNYIFSYKLYFGNELLDSQTYP